MEKTVTFNGTPEQEKQLKEVIASLNGTPGCLMPVMQQAQEIYGYLPIEVQKMIADGLNVPLAKVYGVATFYAQFSLTPKGKHKVSICMGTACYVKGADKLMAAIEEYLGIKNGECTEDGMFSIEGPRCVGACGLAPVLMIDEDIYGKADPKKVAEILEKYKD